jgi:hypothetical protein
VSAGITEEGEAMFDYRNNRAVAAEAGFLTVIGSPMKEAGEPTRVAAGAHEERGSSNRKRHNVYYVWMTPKTTICESTDKSEKARIERRTWQSERKREIAFENLEVGDHVEIQFSLRDDTTSTGSAHQTDQMRRKHGRHRTHVGYAIEVTILPEKDSAAHGAEGDRNEKSRSQ